MESSGSGIITVRGGLTGIMDQKKNEGSNMEHSTNAMYYKLRLLVFIGTDGKGKDVYFGPGTQRLPA